MKFAMRRFEVPQDTLDRLDETLMTAVLFTTAPSRLRLSKSSPKSATSAAPVAYASPVYTRATFTRKLSRSGEEEGLRYLLKNTSCQKLRVAVQVKQVVGSTAQVSWRSAYHVLLLTGDTDVSSCGWDGLICCAGMGAFEAAAVFPPDERAATSTCKERTHCQRSD